MQTKEKSLNSLSSPCPLVSLSPCPPICLIFFDDHELALPLLRGAKKARLVTSKLS
jgi:hypothetical protein